MFPKKSLVNLINVKFIVKNKISKSKMSTWQTEKDKFLSMSIEDKRKNYTNKNFKTLKDISTWKDYAGSVQLPPPTPMLPNCKINNTLNASLVNKISVYQGDITTLEVDTYSVS